ncbi:MAG: hypothetical protein RIC55_02380 [Pirellulaceae bacterium]
MSTAAKTSGNTSLSSARRRLLQLMTRINFGRIEQLPVRDCEPVLEQLPRIVREVKLGRRDRVRQVTEQDAFALKDQVLDLFEHLDRMGSGLIEKIEIQAGLPFRIHVSESAEDS